MFVHWGCHSATLWAKPILRCAPEIRAGGPCVSCTAIETVREKGENHVPGSSPLLWTSPVMHADTRPRDDEPSPGWAGWLTVLAVLAAFAAMIVLGAPS